MTVRKTILNFPSSNIRIGATINDNTVGIGVDNMTDIILSVCKARDIEVWKTSSNFMDALLSTDRYIVIVPDEEVLQFEAVSPDSFEVLSEDQFVTMPQRAKLRERLKSESMEDRFGWYLQQLIKLSALQNFSDYDQLVIWDADTVPLKQINFFNNRGEPIHFIGTEHHEPYFSTIEDLLRMQKLVGYSFITQNFPITGKIADSFFEYIEERHQTNWFDAVVETVAASESSGFSEYETLGTFITNQYSNLPNITLTPWVRNGYAEAGTADISTAIERLREQQYAYAAFEDFHKPGRLDLPLNIRSKSKQILTRGFQIIKNIRPQLLGSDSTSGGEILSDFFEIDGPKQVVQLGANDGVHSDPLRDYLKTPGSYQATLVEPLEYYVNELQELYKGRDDVEIVQAAAGQSTNTRKIFYIPPETADEMNGDGPQNDWAHGQGSFDIQSITSD